MMNHWSQINIINKKSIYILAFFTSSTINSGYNQSFGQLLWHCIITRSFVMYLTVLYVNHRWFLKKKLCKSIHSNIICVKIMIILCNFFFLYFGFYFLSGGAFFLLSTVDFPRRLLSLILFFLHQRHVTSHFILLYCLHWAIRICLHMGMAILVFLVLLYSSGQ